MTEDTGSLTMTTRIGHEARDHANTPVTGHVPSLVMPTGHVRGEHVTGHRLVTCPGAAGMVTGTVPARRDRVHVTALTDTPVMVTAETMPMTNAADGSGDPR